MASLERSRYDKRRRDGRYVASPLCDGCNKPVGTNWYTDAEVCGGGDGPGFFVCERARCSKKLEGLDVPARLAHYTANRLGRKGD